MKKKLEEAKKKESRIREIEEDVLDPVLPKTKAWEACCTLEAAQVEELREAPIPALLELLREDTVAVFKAANCSSGMKDTLVKAIYRATARIRAAAGVLGKGALQAEYGPGRVEGSPRRYPRDPQDSLLRYQEPAAVKTASRSPMVGSSMMDAETEIPPPDITEGPGRGETHMEMDSDPEISHLPPLPSTFRVEEEPREQRAPRVRRREPRNTGPREIVVESPILGRRVIPKPPDTGRRRREAAEEAPPTVVRPSLQGKCTPLEYNYPRGLRPEDKEAYARVSAQIDALLKERERLAQGGTRAAPSTSPPNSPELPLPPPHR